MSRIGEGWRGAADERGFTLTEMIVVLAILSIVLSALIAVFVSALHTEVDQNRRFEAQQNARLALGKLRREIHCAKQATIEPGGAAVTLTSAYSSVTAKGYCQAGTTRWWTVPEGSTFSLYRQVGEVPDGSGKRVAEHLTSGQVFGCWSDPTCRPDGLLYPPYSRAKVSVDVRVDVDPADPRQAYRLYDEIVLRGSPRA
jgi:prepilin-type N-terminal cleavage/methylation domain-containing protein